MITRKDIADLRVKLLQIKAREAAGIRTIDDIIKFFEMFSGSIGELLAMADSFRKIQESVSSGEVSSEHILRCVREFEELVSKQDTIIFK